MDDEGRSPEKKDDQDDDVIDFSRLIEEQWNQEVEEEKLEELIPKVATPPLGELMEGSRSPVMMGPPSPAAAPLLQRIIQQLQEQDANSREDGARTPNKGICPCGYKVAVIC